MSTAMTQYAGAGGELVQWRRPEEVLAEAQQAATALVKVIEMKKNKVVFNNETYLEFEDWQTVAKFYGCTAKVISTKYVEFGEVHGFEAEAVVLDRNQSEIGRSESMCLSDEENWGMVPKYEWQDVLDDQGKKIWDAKLRNGKGGYKATKVQVGATAKPLFQLRSMAQTRASAKALRSIFAWVVVLAGYKPTPAEEMTGHEFDNEPEPRPQVSMPKSTDEKKPPVQTVKAETVQQGQQTQQGAAQGQQQASQGLEQISGDITDAKPGTGKAEGILFLIVGGKLVSVPKALIDPDMVVGSKIVVMATKRTVGKMDQYMTSEVKMVVPLVTDGEIVDAEYVEEKPAEEAKGPDPVLDEARAAGLSGIFDDAPPKKTEAPPAAATAPADSGSEATKPGTAGLKRAQRLHTLITQNSRNTGFTEDHLKRYLATQRIEHARDLIVPPKGSDAFNAYEYACSMAVGEVDWHEILED